MYQIINNDTGVLIEETLNPQFLRQQPLRDFPICANNLAEADGVVLSDGETMVGIAKEYAEGEPNMLNYPPLVRIVEVPDGAYLMGEINRLKSQVNAVQSGVTEVYNVQTEGTVPRTDLDTAYQEGVNDVD